MPFIVEMHDTGNPELQRDIVTMIEHVLSDRRGLGLVVSGLRFESQAKG